MIPNVSEIASDPTLQAISQAAQGIARRRAQVTIDFFSLNDREELIADRARTISAVAMAMKLRSDPEPWRSLAELQLDQLRSDRSPQAACARAYLDLASIDPAKAFEIYKGVLDYLKI